MSSGDSAGPGSGESAGGAEVSVDRYAPTVSAPASTAARMAYSGMVAGVRLLLVFMLFAVASGLLTVALASLMRQLLATLTG